MCSLACASATLTIHILLIFAVFSKFVVCYLDNGMNCVITPVVLSVFNISLKVMDRLKQILR